MTLDHLTEYVSKSYFTTAFGNFLYLEQKGGGAEVGRLTAK
jgi:hypothetical protein